MIKISAKGLALFMTSGPRKQRKILSDFKNPDPEGSAQAVYYREARDFIRAYHKNGRDRDWLIEQAERIESLARMSTGQSRSRLLNNARALRDYQKHFAKKKYEVLNDLNLFLHHSDVRVSVVPDLYVVEKGIPTILKFDFSKDPPGSALIYAVSQIHFDAAVANGIAIKSSSVIYSHVPSGKEHRMARSRSRVQAEIAASCENIEAIWPGI